MFLFLGISFEKECIARGDNIIKPPQLLSLCTVSFGAAILIASCKREANQIMTPKILTKLKNKLLSLLYF